MMEKQRGPEDLSSTSEATAGTPAQNTEDITFLPGDRDTVTLYGAPVLSYGTGHTGYDPTLGLISTDPTAERRKKEATEALQNPPTDSGMSIY